MRADSESGPEGVTEETLKGYIEGMFSDVTSMEDLMERMEGARALFGDGWEGLGSILGVSGAVMSGSEITTRVEVTELEETDVDEALIDAVKELNVDNVEYYDVSVWMSRDGYDFGRLHQLNNKITVALTTVTEPESGYTRKYIVVRQHEGEEPEVLVEGVDFYIEDGVLYVISDKFSTFVVAYADTMIPAYGTGEITGVHNFALKAPGTGIKDKSGSNGGNVTDSVAIVLITMNAVIMSIGAILFAKRK